MAHTDNPGLAEAAKLPDLTRYLNLAVSKETVDAEMKHAAKRARGDAASRLLVGRQVMKKHIHFREFLHLVQRLSIVPHVHELVHLASERLANQAKVRH